MNKGRNILLLLTCLLCVSILAFFTLFQRENTSGVVDNVRYVLDSQENGEKHYGFYFVEGESVKATATEDGDMMNITIDGYEYTYRVNKNTGQSICLKDGQLVRGDEGFSLYTRDFFKTMAVGRERLLELWQAVVIAVLCFTGGAIILYAEELWHIVYKKDKNEIPEWKDMNVIKYVGAGIIAAGVVLFIIFLFI